MKVYVLLFHLGGYDSEPSRVLGFYLNESAAKKRYDKLKNESKDYYASSRKVGQEFKNELHDWADKIPSRSPRRRSIFRDCRE